jgi:hypothetical protein
MPIKIGINGAYDVPPGPSLAGSPAPRRSSVMMMMSKGLRDSSTFPGSSSSYMFGSYVYIVFDLQDSAVSVAS